MVDDLDLLFELTNKTFEKRLLKKPLHLTTDIIGDIEDDLFSFYSDYENLVTNYIDTINTKPDKLLPKIIKLHIQLVDTLTHFIELMIRAHVTAGDLSSQLSDMIDSFGLSDSDYYENKDSMFKLFNFSNFLVQQLFGQKIGKNIIISSTYPACNNISIDILNHSRLLILDIIHSTWLFKQEYKKNGEYSKDLIDAIINLIQLYTVLGLNPEVLLTIYKDLNT